MEIQKQLDKRWFARENFVYDNGFFHLDVDKIEEKPIAECSSHIIALHIACAHNAILESVPN